MKCINCGKEIPDGTVFCRYCGTKQEPQEESHPEEVRKEVKKPKPVVDNYEDDYEDEEVGDDESVIKDIFKRVAADRKLQMMLLGIVGLIVIASIGFNLLSNMAKSVDIQKIVTYEKNTEQLDGNGTISVNLDYDTLDNVINQDKKKKAIQEKYGSDSLLLNNMDEVMKSITASDFFSYEVDKNDSLKNGDVVTVTMKPGYFWESSVTFDEACSKLGMKMKDTYEIKVDWLKKGNYIDLAIDDCKSYVYFSGPEGSGYAEFYLPETYNVGDYYMTKNDYATDYRVVKNNEEVGTISYMMKVADNDYSTRTDSNLKEGDEITLYLAVSDNLKRSLEEDGTIVNTSLGIVKVPELAKPIEDKNALSESDFEKIFRDLGYVDNNMYRGAYIATLKPSAVMNKEFGKLNILYVLKDGRNYSVARVGNLSKNSKGEITVGNDYTYNYVHIDNENDIDGLKELLSNDYDIEKIELSSLQTPADTYGYVEVLVNKLNIREWASTKAPSHGTANTGDIYEIYGTVDEEGYTWYCIGENRYIASKEGTWTRHFN